MVNASTFKTDKKYLSAKDDGKELEGEKLLIDSVFVEEVQDNKGNSKTSLCIRFADTPKVLVLNQTNLALCVEKWGEDTDKWVSQSAKIHMVKVTLNGKLTDGLQIHPL